MSKSVDKKALKIKLYDTDDDDSETETDDRKEQQQSKSQPSATKTTSSSSDGRISRTDYDKIGSGESTKTGKSSVVR